MTDIVDKARWFAENAHLGQYRDDGLVFIVHPKRTAMIIDLITSGKDKNLIAAAWLHDTIEDTDTTYEDLVREFNQDVADLVNEVTQEGKPDSHGYYFPRLKTQRGIMLKFADRLTNIGDMQNWDDKRRAHYLRKSKFWKSE